MKKPARPQHRHSAAPPPPAREDQARKHVKPQATAGGMRKPAARGVSATGAAQSVASPASPAPAPSRPSAPPAGRKAALGRSIGALLATPPVRVRPPAGAGVAPLGGPVATPPPMEDAAAPPLRPAAAAPPLMAAPVAPSAPAAPRAAAGGPHEAPEESAPLAPPLTAAPPSGASLAMALGGASGSGASTPPAPLLAAPPSAPGAPSATATPTPSAADAPAAGAAEDVAPYGTPPRTAPAPGNLSAPDRATGAATLHALPIARIIPNPHQPRAYFDPQKLAELADSIRQHGILQPLIVTRGEASSPAAYTLLAGERRLRAAQLAGLDEVPVHVVEATAEQRLELSIVENVQRDDLNPVEEAQAYRRLMDEFGWTQEQVSTRVAKQRSTVANALRLLRLGPKALDDLRSGRLTAGHARALLAVEDAHRQEGLRLAIVRDGLSVREAERRAGLGRQPVGRPVGTERTPGASSSAAAPGTAAAAAGAGRRPLAEADVSALEQRLVARLECPVRLRARSPRSGVLEIPYASLDDLDRILAILGLEAE